jgi:hypothetical protein
MVLQNSKGYLLSEMTAILVRTQFESADGVSIINAVMTPFPCRERGLGDDQAGCAETSSSADPSAIFDRRDALPSL